MADPTPDEVRAALAILAAAETARESHVQSTPAAPVEPVKPSESPAVTAADLGLEEMPKAAEPTMTPPVDDEHVAVGSSLFRDPTKLKVDPYLARSVKSSPNGF